MISDESSPIRDLQAARRMSHGAQLERSARKFSDKVAFRFLDRSLTFSELDARVTLIETGDDLEQPLNFPRGNALEIDAGLSKYFE